MDLDKLQAICDAAMEANKNPLESNNAELVLKSCIEALDAMPQLIARVRELEAAVPSSHEHEYVVKKGRSFHECKHCGHRPGHHQEIEIHTDPLGFLNKERT